MPVDPNAPISVTGFRWVPGFAQGQVRDLRPRWALEELNLSYSERLFSAMEQRPDDYYREQPWGQVPVLRDGDEEVFESGAILLHLGEKDARLLPTEERARLKVISWLFAAFSSIEPFMMQIATVDIFAKDEEWAKLRRPGLLEFTGQRLDRLAVALGDKPYFAGDFSIADIAMATILRIPQSTDLVRDRPALAAYVARCEARPAFQIALAAQMETYAQNEPQTA